MSSHRFLRAAALMRRLQRSYPQHTLSRPTSTAQPLFQTLSRRLSAGPPDSHDPSKAPATPGQAETFDEIETLSFPDPKDPHQHPLASFLDEATRQDDTYWASKTAQVAGRVYERKVDDDGCARARGGRKTSTARVALSEGKGTIVVNGRPWVDYFRRVDLRDKILRPLIITGMLGRVNLEVKTYGGGIMGQAEAVRHGVSRALQNWNPEWRKALKKNGLLTRDSRSVEMKKYGRKKARKSFQWVKR